MNENVHNVAVATFQEKVKNHENAIIDGTKVAHDLNDFIALHEELSGILDEKFQLYNADKSEKAKNELDSFLREELDYLDLIENLMQTLDQYHDVVGFVDSAMIEKEWADVRIIVTYQNLEKSLNRVGELMKTYPEERYSESYQAILEKKDKLLKQVVDAEYNMLDRSSMDVNTATNDEITPNVDWNKNAFEKMDIKEKIQYLEEKMAEIEHSRGTKRIVCVNGERKNIPKKYAARYSKYNSILNNLKMKLAKEEKELDDLSARITSQVGDIFSEQTNEEIYSLQTTDDRLFEGIDVYLECRKEMHEIDQKMSTLLMKAYDKGESEVVHITLPNGKPGRILRSDLEEYEKLEKSERINHDKFARLMYEEGIIPDAADERTPDEKKTEILERIQFLKSSGVTGEALDSEIQKLMNEYRKVEKRKKFISMAGLTRLFMEQGYSRDEAHRLAFISYDPEAFQKSKRTSVEEKKNIFSKLFQSFSSSVMHAKSAEVGVEEFALMCVEPKKSPFASLYTVGINVKEYISKVLKAVKSVPSKVGNYVSKIKKTRKPKNRAYLQGNVKKKLRNVAAVMGFTAVLAAAVTSGSKTNAPVQSDVSVESVDDNTFASSTENVEDIAEELGDTISGMVNKEEEKTDSVTSPSLDDSDIVLEDIDSSLPEESQSVYIGDVFTTKMDSEIYTNMYDAAKSENGLHAYFASDSNREVTGLVYDYNGTSILLDENDPDFEAQKTALESNGAVLVAVRSENEAAKDTGASEGYWNVSDIVLENEEGIQR